MKLELDNFFKVKMDAERENKIATILSTGEQCEVNIEHEFNGVTFRGPETELRILFLSTIKLTISNVKLHNRRCGTMSKVLTQLIEFCTENEIEKIVVQSVSTKDMMEFCLKHGFKPDPNASLSNGEMIIGDYVLSA